MVYIATCQLQAFQALKLKNIRNICIPTSLQITDGSVWCEMEVFLQVSID